MWTTAALDLSTSELSKVPAVKPMPLSAATPEVMIAAAQAAPKLPIEAAAMKLQMALGQVLCLSRTRDA